MYIADIELIARMGAGSADAFAAFYDRFAPRLLGLLKRLLHHTGDAEDVLQDTFWQAWNRAATYDAARAAPEAWLFMLGRSRALDLLRRRHAVNGHPAGIDKHVWSAPEAGLEKDENRRRVIQAIRNLPIEQQTAVRLSFFGGLTHQQISTREQIPLGTAKARIRLGMQHMRTMLDH